MKHLLLLALLFASPALAVDNPVSCTGNSCTVTIKPRTSGGAATPAISAAGTGVVTFPTGYGTGNARFNSSGVVSSVADDASVSAPVSTSGTINGNTTVCGSFAEPSTVIRLTSFVPTVTGKYMIMFAGLPISISATAGRVKLNITNTVGGAANTFSQETSIDFNAANIPTPLSAYRIDNLTAGTSYTYAIEGCGSNSPGTITFNNSLPTSGVSLTAFRIH